MGRSWAIGWGSDLDLILDLIWASPDGSGDLKKDLSANRRPSRGPVSKSSQMSLKTPSPQNRCEKWPVGHGENNKAKLLYCGRLKLVTTKSSLVVGRPQILRPLLWGHPVRKDTGEQECVPKQDSGGQFVRRMLPAPFWIARPRPFVLRL